VSFVSAAIVLLVLFARGLGAQYVGHQVCAECHPQQSTSQAQTAHAHALAPAPKDAIGQWAFGAGLKAITYVSQLDPARPLLISSASKSPERYYGPWRCASWSDDSWNGASGEVFLAQRRERFL
jgi:hypothetical protein